MIAIGQYRVCVLDFLTDENGKLSATKLWFHVANVILSKAMLAQSDLSAEKIFAYGCVVGGSHVASLFMRLKYANRSDPELDTK